MEKGKSKLGVEDEWWVGPRRRLEGGGQASIDTKHREGLGLRRGRRSGVTPYDQR